MGPGMVVGEELSETIRSHLDLTKDNANAKYTKKALKHHGAHNLHVGYSEYTSVVSP